MKNQVLNNDDPMDLTLDHPASPVSGDPVRFGELCGVAVNTENATTGKTPTLFTGVHNISVKGIDAGGNSAVANGDKLFYTDADSPPVSKKATGRPVGFAMATVSSGGTATIAVRLATF